MKKLERSLTPKTINDDAKLARRSQSKDATRASTARCAGDAGFARGAEPRGHNARIALAGLTGCNNNELINC